MAPHSSTLASKIPWTEEPGRLQSTGLWRVRHDWMTSLSLFIFRHWRRKWQPTPVFLPGESQGRGAWWAADGAPDGVAQSRTRLKQPSSSSPIRKLKCLNLNGKNSELWGQVPQITFFPLHLIWTILVMASQVVLVVKNLPANAGDNKRCGFAYLVGKIPWRRAWQPSPVFLPGESCRQSSLASCSP